MQLEKAKVIARPSNKQCVHHWVIDAYNIGRCIKPGCGAVKDFGALLEKEPMDWIGGLRGTLRRG